jgi:hypothetical protein
MLLWSFSVPRELRLIASRDDILSPTITDPFLDSFKRLGVLASVEAVIFDMDGTLTEASERFREISVLV